MAHPYRFVLLNGMTNPVKIDIEVVDLVVALNLLGWHTEQSCQNNIDERVWIQFKSTTEAEHFLNLITKRSLSLHECVFNGSTERHDKHPLAAEQKDRWWVDSFLNSSYWRKNIIDQLFIHISVRFPREHLEKVTKIVTDYAKGIE